MYNISRRDFLKATGGIIVLTGFNGIASALDDALSLTDKQNIIIEKLKKMPVYENNIDGTWYKIHETSVGPKGSELIVQSAEPTLQSAEPTVQLGDSYLSMLSFNENSLSLYYSVKDGKLDGRKHLAVRNKKPIFKNDMEDFLGGIAKIVRDPAYKSNCVVSVEADPNDIEKIVDIAYDSLKEK